jgi:V/A-type H+-transporting ATPase subunit C
MLKTKRVSPLDYAFAIGKIRALETRLIKRNIFEEMVAASPIDEALKILSEAGDYPDEVMRIKDSTNLESILKKESEKNTTLVKKLLLEGELLEPLIWLDNLIESLESAARCKNIFLISYLRHFIDLANIKVSLRMINLARPKDNLAKALFMGGYIGRDKFLKTYDQPLHIFIANFRYTDYAEAVREGTEYFQRQNSFLRLERKVDDYLIGFIKQSKYITFGPEPILAYYLAKQNEIKLIRLVIIGRLNNLPKEEILERLNDTYV